MVSKVEWAVNSAIIPPSGDHSLVLTSKEVHMDEARENLSLAREYSKYMANWHSVSSVLSTNVRIFKNQQYLWIIWNTDQVVSIWLVVFTVVIVHFAGSSGSTWASRKPRTHWTSCKWKDVQIMTHYVCLLYVWSVCHRMNAHLPFVSLWRVCLVKLDFQANPESLESLWVGLLFSNKKYIVL